MTSPKGSGKSPSISLNPDKELVAEIRDALLESGGYCPCSTKQDEDHRCPCKEFREQSSGFCHCGLYYKEGKQ